MNTARIKLAGLVMTVFAANLCLMVVEITAGRIVSKFLGQSIYSWTSVIGVVLGGMAVGNWFGGWLADRRETKSTAGTLFALSALSCLTIPTVNAWCGDQLFLLEMDWPARIFFHVLLVFFLPAFVTGAVSPVIGKEVLSVRVGVGRTLGSLYAWAAIGSVTGTFLAGYVLIGSLALFTIIALVACVLALMGVLYHPRRLWLWIVMAGALLTLWAASSDGPLSLAIGRYTQFQSRQRPGEISFYQKDGRYSFVEVWAQQESPKIRRLDLDRLQHSIVDINHVDALLAPYGWVVEAILSASGRSQKPPSALVIGGGGYTIPRHIRTEYPGSRILVAEIEPSVTEAAIRSCALDTNGIAIVHKDARNAVDEILAAPSDKRTCFDWIIGDTINDCAIPYHLITREFNDKVYGLLAHQGVYLLHVIDRFSSPVFLGTVVNTLEKTFPFVGVMATSRNIRAKTGYVVVCSGYPMDLSGIPGMIQKSHPTYAGWLLSERQVSCLKRWAPLSLSDDYAPVDHLVAHLVALGRSELANKYTALSASALKAGDVPKAMRYMNCLVRDYPENPLAYYHRAQVLAQCDALEDALRDLGRVLSLDPFHVEGRRLKACVVARRGDLAGAISEWESILADNAQDTEALNAMGLALNSLGRTDEAVARWQEVVRLDGGNATANFYLAKILLGRGEVSRALAHAQKVGTDSVIMEPFNVASNGSNRIAAPLFY